MRSAVPHVSKRPRPDLEIESAFSLSLTSSLHPYLTLHLFFLSLSTACLVLAWRAWGSGPCQIKSGWLRGGEERTLAKLAGRSQAGRSPRSAHIP